MWDWLQHLTEQQNINEGTMKKTLGIIALSLGLVSPAFANPAQLEQSSEDKYKQMDSNADGKVNLDEFKALYPTMKSNVFGIIDVNGDKIIDLKEWIAFQEEHMMGMKNDKAQKKRSMGPGDEGGRGANQGMQPAETHPGGNMLISPPPAK